MDAHEGEDDYLVSEVTVETGIGTPDVVSTLVHQENVNIAPQESRGTTSILGIISPHEPPDGGRVLTTRSEKLPKARASTPPIVPISAKNQAERPLLFTMKKQISDENKGENDEPKNGSKFHWKRGKFLRSVSLPEMICQTPRTNPQEGPIAYFSKFFTEELIEFAVQQTNLYWMQKTSECINLCSKDIRDFVAVHIYMGLCRMNSYRDYWSDRLCWGKINNIMSRSKYAEIRRFLHLADFSIECPALIKDYNQSMGGVDKTDILVAIRENPLKSYKWYINIFSWLLDVSLSDSWVLYRKDHPQSKIALNKFKSEVAEGLLLKGRPRNMKIAKNKTPEPAPSKEVRHDQINHFPVAISKGKCGHCHLEQTVWACDKCNQRLCLNGKKNCFLHYHTI
ncbi:piggyBac transposable element derived [Nesidiocoris tenuis]|uniref:PiggyBac transposable element derived n=1 Tax=Nesidiocoris tenuis TaxID=355587 RepID=A0ABN7AJR4_9HEMI|nr:piggyBac transposable element derived [Nesidiocoris tenuis]